MAANTKSLRFGITGGAIMLLLGLLILVAALASLVGAQVVVFAVLVPWRLATSFVAVERALEVGRAKSAVALLLGVGCGLALVELGTVTLLNVLA